MTITNKEKRVPQLAALVKRFWPDSANSLMRHKSGSIGLVTTMIFVAIAVFAPVIVPFDPISISYDHPLTPPSWPHVFGTDQLGRDVFSRVVYGAQVTIQVAFAATVLSVVIGVSIGLISGYFGGVVDAVVMRIMEGLQAFPMLILALAIVAALGPNLINAVIAISVANIPRFARLVRSQTLSLREQDFVQAAKALGAGDARIMFRHILPNTLDNIIVFASLRASTAIVTEAGLAFLGLGVQPPFPTWGGMLTDGLLYLESWWLSFFPGIALFFAVLGLNFLGDGLRDIVDSRHVD